MAVRFGNLADEIHKAMAGAMAALIRRFKNIRNPVPYKMGTVEADVFLSGYEEGYSIGDDWEHQIGMGSPKTAFIPGTNLQCCFALIAAMSPNHATYSDSMTLWA